MSAAFPEHEGSYGPFVINNDNLAMAPALAEEALIIDFPDQEQKLESVIDIGAAVVSQGLSTEEVAQAEDSENDPAKLMLLGTLTDGELDVLGLLSLGMANKEIAEELVVSEQTVKFHLSNVYRKLNVKGRMKARNLANEVGLLEFALAHSEDNNQGPFLGHTKTVLRERTEMMPDFELIKRLTDREFEVLVFAKKGLSNAEIASHLYIAEHTVKFHLTHAYGKLEVKTRLEASRFVPSEEEASRIRKDAAPYKPKAISRVVSIDERRQLAQLAATQRNIEKKVRSVINILDGANNVDMYFGESPVSVDQLDEAIRAKLTQKGVISEEMIKDGKAGIVGTIYAIMARADSTKTAVSDAMLQDLICEIIEAEMNLWFENIQRAA